jgi:hypothetical protein
MWGAAQAGRTSSFMHLLLHPPSVWALKPPSWALVHKTTYAPMNYTIYSPVHIVLDACISNTWASGRGLGPGILECWAQMALAYRLVAISQGPKNSQIPGPYPLPLAQGMDMHASKTLCTELYKS